MSWFAAHWQELVIAVLAIDRALIPLFPSWTLLEKIQEWLAKLAPKQ